MSAIKQLYKQNDDLEVFLTDGEQVVKRYKHLDEVLRERLQTQIAFLTEFTHPYLPKLLKYQLEANKAELVFSYAPGKSITNFLVDNPHKITEIWKKLCHFCRYLMFHSLFLGDLKPEHIIIDENLAIHIIDVAPYNSILNLQWAAPEQLDGQLGWQSNLYTFALIIASLEIPLETIKSRLQKDLPLKFSEDFPLKNDYIHYLHPNPGRRLNAFYGEDPSSGLVLQSTMPQEDFLGLHLAVCEKYYLPNIPYGYLSHALQTDRQQKSLADSVDYYMNKDFFLKTADALVQKFPLCFRDGEIYYRGKKKNYSNVAEAIACLKRSCAEFNLNFYADALEYLLANLESALTLNLQEALFLATKLQFSRHYQRFMYDYLTKNQLTGESKSRFIYQWLLFSFYRKDDFLDFVGDYPLNKPLESLLRLREYAKNNDTLSLLKVFQKERLPQEQEVCLREYLFFQASQKEFGEELANFYLTSNDFEKFAFYTVYNEIYSTQKNEKKIGLALLLAGHALQFTSLETLTSLAHLAIMQGRQNKLIDYVVRYYENGANNRLLPQETPKELLSSIAHYYYMNRKFDRFVKFTEKNLNRFGDETPYILNYYLNSKIIDHDFGFDHRILKIIRKYIQDIYRLFPDIIKKMAFYINAYAEKSDKKEISRIFNLQVEDKDANFFVKQLSDLYAKSHYNTIFKLLREREAKNTYELAENYYYAALSLSVLKQDAAALTYYRIALHHFNNLGLFNRGKEIAKYLGTPLADTVSKNLSFNFETSVKNIVESNKLSDFLEILSETFYFWLGFEVTIPFLFDKETDSFTPLSSLNDHFEAGFEGLKYSSHILNSYKQTHKIAYLFNALEANQSESIALLNIQSAYCLPLLMAGEFIGTIYLHTKNPTVKISSELQPKISAFATVAGLVMQTLYAKEMNKRILENDADNFHGIIGNSQKIRQLIGQIKKYAPLPYSILINGESGAGKELVARAVFKEGNYRGKLVSLNCSNIPKDLFESELFGYTKGAFSSADKDKTGKIKEAENGIIFFDEIGDLPYELQAKMLRILENRTYYPVGGNIEQKSNARFIFATNQNLANLVQENSFRADLYARIRQFQLDVPPLRERTADLPLLVEHFTRLFVSENPKIDYKPVPPATVKAWAQRPWNLNIRELKYEVFRELLNDKKETAIPESYFKISLQEQLGTKEIVRKYVLWLREELGSPAAVISFLKITAPTYYRLIKK